MKNPLLDNKIKQGFYITAATIVAVIYAYTCGWVVGFPVICILSDAFIFGLIFASGIAFLWNILRYGTPSPEHQYYRMLYIVILGLFLILLSVGGEFLLFWSYFPDYVIKFLPTIYIRIFVASLLYMIASIYYLSRLEYIELQEQEPITDPMEVLPAQDVIETITIKTGTGIKVIHVDEIVFIKAEGDYVSVHTTEGQWLKEQTMKYMEIHLPCKYFLRIHRSFIINTSLLKRIERYGQQHLVELRNGDKIKISPAGYKALKEKMNL